VTLCAHWIGTDVSKKPVALLASYSEPDDQIHNVPTYFLIVVPRIS